MTFDKEMTEADIISLHVQVTGGMGDLVMPIADVKTEGPVCGKPLKFEIMGKVQESEAKPCPIPAGTHNFAPLQEALSSSAKVNPAQLAMAEQLKGNLVMDAVVKHA